MAVLWIEFALCTAVIAFCGTNLARYGDVIAEKTGLGRAWIGLILMSGVTSLPELITGISSVAIAQAPDIAVGDVMGSCVFNLLLIAVMDMLHRKAPIFRHAEHGHALSAGFGVILIGLASLSILAGAAVPSWGAVSLTTPVLIAFYAVGMRSVYLYQKRKIAERAGEIAEQLQYGSVTVRDAAVKYGLNAAVIIAAATWLPFIGDAMATATGLGRSFVGSVLVAMTTSLPELVVTVAALRIGAADMAIANLLGSNMFNIFILALDDLAFWDAPLYGAVSTNHVVTGSIALVMTGIVVVSMTYRLQRKTVLRIGWDAVALLLAYVANISLLYLLRDKG